ncbi:ATP-dependent protease ATPase subunit HslU [Clostridium sp. 'deep sea']|uniref:ATP-dependent protease ATPase subunit HslU n=1 Tax=Clostridium sp. 'deep sea' TaxID=2779445 RepID=UPI00189691C1|nr:ATP-dependent protease ATPase subunit HslU [Clostridium sp. 'deep sea']QOR36034.1 ATP-dependent protease ATPase subunit HslU [Clostridium sp. 'deep sea']
MNNLTPKQIVAKLDEYIVGQHEAKKAVAIALRNRYRRKLLMPDLQEEIMPKNIIMIGPTGVGKTEIARRLAKLVEAPLIKVEATKFTEVGYVGRDAESMIRELLEICIRMEKTKRMKNAEIEAEKLANERILEVLVDPQPKQQNSNPLGMIFSNSFGSTSQTQSIETEEQKKRRESLRERLLSGELENMVIEIEVTEKSSSIQFIGGGSGLEEMGVNMGDIFGNLLPSKKKNRRVTVAEARRVFVQEESENLVDMDDVIKVSIEKTEQSGIVFLDEIDKIAVKSGGGRGPDVSREGVQRDILPIVEGTTVNTKYGPVKTDYILFIAAGAFHIASPSDLIPELQGRFPIRVELQSLSTDDMKRVLIEPKHSLIKQYIALLGTEHIQVVFTDEAISEIAKIACQVNNTSEDIGARRLHTIMERLLEHISYNATELDDNKIVIDSKYVYDQLGSIMDNDNLHKYII